MKISSKCNSQRNPGQRMFATSFSAILSAGESIGSRRESLRSVFYSCRNRHREGNAGEVGAFEIGLHGNQSADSHFSSRAFRQQPPRAISRNRNGAQQQCFRNSFFSVARHGTQTGMFLSSCVRSSKRGRDAPISNR